MRQKQAKVILSNFNPAFIMDDTGGKKSITLSHLLIHSPPEDPQDSGLHIQVIDQKELSLFDRALTQFNKKDSGVLEVPIDESFGIFHHITVKVYSSHNKAFEAELFYTIHYEP